MQLLEMVILKMRTILTKEASEKMFRLQSTWMKGKAQMNETFLPGLRGIGKKKVVVFWSSPSEIQTALGGVYVVGIIANCVSALVYLAPVFTFRRIYMARAVLGFSCIPYLVAFFSSLLWLYYAIVKKNSTLLLSIYSAGAVLEAVYIGIYIFFVPALVRRWTGGLALIRASLFVLVVLVTVFAFHGDQRIDIVGWICVVVSVLVNAAPLSVVVRVIQEHNAEFIPFALSVCLTADCIAWFVYGLFENDVIVLLPNILGFLFGLVQVVLHFVYRCVEETPEEGVEPDV